MGRAPEQSEVCPLGVKIGRPLRQGSPEWALAGPCHACGAGPLHPWGSHACGGCSFLRERLRLCRVCAIAYDYVTRGSTRIKGAPFTPAAWNHYRHLAAVGAIVVQLTHLQQQDDNT